MKETIVRCDVCKRIIKETDNSDNGSSIVIDIQSEPGYLSKYYNITGYKSNSLDFSKVKEKSKWIDWPDVCPACRKHLAKRLAEAINEIWKEE